MSQDTLSQAIDAGLRTSPPLTVAAASFAGLPLEYWVYLFTLIYTVVQLAYTLWNWRREYSKKWEKRKDYEGNGNGKEK